MSEEDKKWFNGIYPYLKMLVKINCKLDKLIKHDNDSNIIEHKSDIFFDLSSELVRLLPFKLKYDKSLQTIVGIELLYSDGILLLKDYIGDLENDYKEIIDKYFVDLVQIIKIRNKYIHEPHNIQCDCFVFGGKHAYAGFKYKKEAYELDTDSLVGIINKLNTTFQKIKKKFEEKVDNLDEKDKDHPYIRNVRNLFTNIK